MSSTKRQQAASQALQNTASPLMHASHLGSSSRMASASIIIVRPGELVPKKQMAMLDATARSRLSPLQTLSKTAPVRNTQRSLRLPNQVIMLTGAGQHGNASVGLSRLRRLTHDQG